MISRTRNEWATRMIAPTLNGLRARRIATLSGRRSFSRLARISSSGISNGGTFMALSTGGDRRGRGRVAAHEAGAERHRHEDADEHHDHQPEDQLAARRQRLLVDGRVVH